MRTILCAALAAALAAVETPAPAPTATAALALTPERFQVQRSIQYDNGVAMGEEQECTFTLRFNAPTTLRLPEMGMRGGNVVTVTAAETDAGESLVPAEQDRHQIWSQSGRFGRRVGGDADQNRVQLTLALRPPTKPCTKLVRLAGTISAQMADEKLKMVELKPISQHSGTPIDIEGLDGVELTVTRTDKGVTFAGSSRAFTALADFRLLSPAGGEIETRGWSSSSRGNDRIERRYDLNLPADGAVRLFFLQGLKPVTVPFAITDVAISAPAAKPRRTIRGVDVPGIDQAPAPKGKPGGNDF